MKTVQQLYNKLIDGEVTKSKFLYEVRRDENLKQFITNLTSFDDSIRILKNRGIITEAKKKVKECLTLDEANPYEYKMGLDHELGIEYQQTPTEIALEAFEKAQMKVLSNLAKDPNYYTKCKAGDPKDESSYYELVKNKNFNDAKNAMKVAVKKEKANVQDTLGNKEKAKSKSAGVKIDGKNPPNPKKKLNENIPSSNTSVIPFDKVQPGQKAVDDSGDQFRILAKGKYQDLKQFDRNKTFDRFLSSDPQGIDINQVVAVKDQEGNTAVRAYGTGGIYVFGGSPLSEGILKFSDGVKVDTSGKLRPLKLDDGWYVVGDGKLIPVRNAQQANTVIAQLDKSQVGPDAASNAGFSAKLGTYIGEKAFPKVSKEGGLVGGLKPKVKNGIAKQKIAKEAIIVKADTPEADPNRLKKYIDKGLDIKLDTEIKEMKLSNIVKQIVKEADAGLEAAISNKEVPQSAQEIAEAKALVLPILTKANLASAVDLDRDVALKNGNIWVQINLGNGLLTKEMVKGLSGDSSFMGLNPVSNTVITVVFKKA